MTAGPGRIRVLIVEDSPVAAMMLEHVIGADGRFGIAGVASSGEEALTLMPRLVPDIVLMDVQLPGMDGVETTRRIMQVQPTPIVVTSASFNGREVTVTMEALKAGALTAIEKPLSPRHGNYPRLARHLCNQLAIMSGVAVIRQRPGGMVQRPTGPKGIPAAATKWPQPDPGERYRMLGLVASTGGPSALARVLGALPKNFSMPVVIVQHIGADFTEGFAAWLDGQVPMRVQLARHGERALPGHAYVAPGDAHLVLHGEKLVLDGGPRESGQRPSGTVLFRSMAASLAGRAIGVLLTGMGDDGATGLLAMRRAGAHTVIEDECTAIVYGMPAVAARLGAGCLQLPLDSIGPHILQATKNNSPS